MKDKYAMMYDGKNWNLTVKDDKKNYIKENLDKYVELLSITCKER